MTAPFPFPVVAVSRGDVQVHRTAESLGLLPERVAKRGEVPPMEVFVETGHVWRPHRISAIAPTGKRLFGREMVHATFEFERVRMLSWTSSVRPREKRSRVTQTTCGTR
jgi:hypothetical protein